MRTCYGLFRVRGRVKTLVRRLGRTKAGRTALLAATVGDPRELRFSTARWWPDEARGFEDLAFLFTSSQLNHGIISQELDEAALLYRLARDVDGGAVVEIGRFKGGSTLLLAAALGGRAELWSYDIHAPHQATYTGADLDEELRDALRRLSLEERVHLVVGDSRLVSPPERADRAPVRRRRPFLRGRERGLEPLGPVARDRRARVVPRRGRPRRRRDLRRWRRAPHGRARSRPDARPPAECRWHRPLRQAELSASS